MKTRTHFIPSNSSVVIHCERHIHYCIMKPDSRDEYEMHLEPYESYQEFNIAPGPEGALELLEVEPETLRPEYAKLVYDNPKPNSNRGAILAASK